MGNAKRIGSCALLAGLVLGLWSRGLSHAQGRGVGADDRMEEDVPGHPDKVKVTHIFRDHRGKGRPGPANCVCGGPEGSAFSLEKAKWFDPTLSFKIYTAHSQLGPSVAEAVEASFGSWTAADPAAPGISATRDDASPGPGIAFDGEQNVSWQPLSAVYGSNTLAVTVYWYSRVKTGGFSRILHFDMAFNADYAWSLPGSPESCGLGASFDVQNVGTHEAGHVYGMAHNNDCNLTMNPTATSGETVKSTLAAGDVNGIRSIY